MPIEDALYCPVTSRLKKKKKDRAIVFEDEEF